MSRQAENKSCIVTDFKRSLDKKDYFIQLKDDRKATNCCLDSALRKIKTMSREICLCLRLAASCGKVIYSPNTHSIPSIAERLLIITLDIASLELFQALAKKAPGKMFLFRNRRFQVDFFMSMSILVTNTLIDVYANKP